MYNKEEITRALNTIRSMIDTDISNCDITDVDKKLKLLTQLTGLSAEANASAMKFLRAKELQVFKENVSKGYQASVLNGLIKSGSGEELALYEYADRLNAALVHTIDGLRTSISLYKTELSSGLIQGQTNT